jgi:hypothetical protein
MKYILILATALISYNALAQVDSPQSSEKAPKVKSSVASDTSVVPGIMLGFGLLPSHQLRRKGFYLYACANSGHGHASLQVIRGICGS